MWEGPLAPREEGKHLSRPECSAGSHHANGPQQRPADVVATCAKRPPLLALRGKKGVGNLCTLLFHYPLLYINMQV